MEACYIGETIWMVSMFAVRLNQLLIMYFDLVGHLLSKLHLSRTVSESLHRFHHSTNYTVYVSATQPRELCCTLSFNCSQVNKEQSECPVKSQNYYTTNNLWPI